MDSSRVKFSESSNGDCWFLRVAGSPNGAALVLHEPNLASGGSVTTFPLTDFLNRDVGSPQHSALLDLLVSQKATTADRGVARKPLRISEREKHYEPGMHVSWDMLTREVVVIFRGAVISAQQRFDSRDQAIDWGEDLCRGCGWEPGDGTL